MVTTAEDIFFSYSKAKEDLKRKKMSFTTSLLHEIGPITKLIL